MDMDENQAEDVKNVENTTEDSTEEVNIEELIKQNSELKNDYLRAYAELENAKKRFQQELEKSSKYAISSFAKELLNVADNLSRALEAGGGSECTGLRQGVELTESELMKVFTKFGVSKIESLGQVFNPSYHQVVQEVEDKSKPVGTIVEELQTGYMINDRILRDAMVVVTKK